jgi:hypothetical protein
MAEAPVHCGDLSMQQIEDRITEFFATQPAASVMLEFVGGRRISIKREDWFEMLLDHELERKMSNG